METYTHSKYGIAGKNTVCIGFMGVFVSEYCWNFNLWESNIFFAVFQKRKKKEEENLKCCIELFQYTCNAYIINGIRTLVLIGTGCTGSCKYNYLTITTTTVSFIRMNSAHAPSRNKNNILMLLSYTTNHLLIKRPHKIVNPID